MPMEKQSAPPGWRMRETSKALIVEEGDECICTINIKTYSPEAARGEAYARLIAAAPALLASLKAIIAWDDATLSDFLPVELGKDARAALSRATSPAGAE